MHPYPLVVAVLTALLMFAASPSSVMAQDALSYDSTRAAELGADDYGMHRYVIAILRMGPSRSHSKEEAAEIQRAHLENIRRMAEEGTLVLAGPFMDDGAMRGIYIFDVDSVDEARALTETDPAVQSGRLTMDLHPWYGSAALKEVNDLNATIQKVQF